MAADAAAAATGAASILDSGLCRLCRGVWPPCGSVRLLTAWLLGALCHIRLALGANVSVAGRAEPFLRRFADHAALSEVTMAFAIFAANCDFNRYAGCPLCGQAALVL